MLNSHDSWDYDCEYPLHTRHRCDFLRALKQRNVVVLKRKSPLLSIASSFCEFWVEMSFLLLEDLTSLKGSLDPPLLLHFSWRFLEEEEEETNSPSRPSNTIHAEETGNTGDLDSLLKEDRVIPCDVALVREKKKGQTERDNGKQIRSFSCWSLLIPNQNLDAAYPNISPITNRHPFAPLCYLQYLIHPLQFADHEHG